MRKLLTIIALSLSLAGCAGANKSVFEGGSSIVAPIRNPIGQSELDKIRAAYGSALAIAVGYRDACAQRLIPASCRTAVRKMQPYGEKAQRAFVVARNFVANNPTISAVSVLQAAWDAVKDLQLVQNELGVK